MDRNLLETGKIVAAHGVRGEVKIQPWADSPDFICAFDTLYVGGEPMTVAAARVHKNAALVQFDGITTIDEAARLRGKTVYVSRDEIELEAGAHFITDLIGFDAVDAETGQALGTVADILTHTGQDLYVIRGARELLIPAVPEFVKKIDADARQISFKLIEGL